MNTENQKITRLHLKSLGLTDYLVREIVKELPSEKENLYNIYSVSDVQKSIQQKLNNPRTKDTSRKKLAVVLEWLDGKSNVIEVDFLKNLTPDQRLEFLYKRNHELFEKEKEINQETDELLRKARQMIAK
ncbi:hypothetical protein RZS08_05675 [Arthrospira platensis SPKY1]|uniref:Uncharacterized protein n=2 Tax=Limnospira TaxID=2596745 RepID=A0A9P1P147_9CYAN|nr:MULTISPECIES: hypothetical protein [Limnospira]EKD08912.1 hypothetical protein SPLC1_S203130 [Arthrospira platensis C1]MDV7390819.1 hypothetical protein [Arthrospira platensis SPKY1]MDY7051892.1 hypothetical protein [Limnospira fusiformis LS22]MDT9176131.1 hypothetical protein [Limnospira sp. PMC 1238.20]MDT9186777.1 hypothetical protein [Limnospira sp. PMC 894.15]